MLLPCKNENTLIIGAHRTGGTMMLTEAIKRGNGSFIIAAPDTCKFPVFSHLKDKGYATCIIKFGENNTLDKSDPLFDAEWVCRDDKNVLFVDMQDTEKSARYINRLLWALKDIKAENTSQLSLILDDPTEYLDGLVPLMECGREKGISIILNVHSSIQFASVFGEEQNKAVSLLGNVLILKMSDITTAAYIAGMFGIVTINPGKMMELELGKAIILNGKDIRKACIYHG